jgi:uncharacterized membrane protein YeaQ/YmgE (transglycosylase-associated protein family)
MLHIIWYIIVGFIVGLIARAIMPGAQHLGFIMTTLLGIGGSIVGGLIGRLFSKPEPGSTFHPAGFNHVAHRRDHSAVYLDKVSGLTKAFSFSDASWMRGTQCLCVRVTFSRPALGFSSLAIRPKSHC